MINAIKDNKIIILYHKYLYESLFIALNTILD